MANSENPVHPQTFSMEQLQSSLYEAADEETRVLYLDVPDSQVVSLQAHFELYESLGSVRTIIQGKVSQGRHAPKESMRSVVAILTTTSQVEACSQALKALYAETLDPQLHSSEPRAAGDHTPLDARPLTARPLNAANPERAWRVVSPTDPLVMGQVSAGLIASES